MIIMDQQNASTLHVVTRNIKSQVLLLSWEISCTLCCYKSTLGICGRAHWDPLPSSSQLQVKFSGRDVEKEHLSKYPTL